MQIEQRQWTAEQAWQPDTAVRLGESAGLLLAFGGTTQLAEGYPAIRAAYPAALILGCSTAGEIHGTRVFDDSLVTTAVRFERTPIRLASTRIDGNGDSRAAGAALAHELMAKDLAHVLVLSDGLRVNGSELVNGLRETLGDRVSVTGGLAGDGPRFQHTVVAADAPPAEGVVAALGLYGEHIRVGHGSLGGWDPFGPERLVTRSRGNVLYELDGRSALELYKDYLGEHAAGLPATGLLFPLALRGDTEQRAGGLVRTILAVDEAEQSMTFAGDVPEGSHAQLMKANFDRLIEGAYGAARASLRGAGTAGPELAVLISCVGRKLVLKQRIEEEVEGVREVLGKGAALTGFYSYGEISPFQPTARCELHNQTMTITTFAE